MMYQPVVTAAQMKLVEEAMFAAGLPVSALMEKVALRLVERFVELFPRERYGRVGVLVGSGHNGGDALVMARELWHRGWQVQVHLLPMDRIKPLTHTHLQYAKFLGIPQADLASLKNCGVLIDGWFGVGLTKELSEGVINAIATVNGMGLPVVSIDLPSGLNSDRGVPWGAAIRARYTFCLGLWKPACLLDRARLYVGEAELVEFDIPQVALDQGLGERASWWCLTPEPVLRSLPLERSPTVHKYQVGSLLMVVGSRTYGGAAVLAGLGAKATGVGMLTIAVPESIRDLVLAQVPDAVVLACPETDRGAIAQLPQVDLHRYDAIACGCGWTGEAQVLERLLASDRPLVIDADGLNLLAQVGLDGLKPHRILTPHAGEFSRLFPDLDLQRDCLHSVQIAARRSGAVILLKGAHTLISSVQQGLAQVWINPLSTSALARGGCGDVLTGMIAGLLAQGIGCEQAAIAATVWQAQAGIWLASQRTVMGVDSLTLAQNLTLFLHLGAGL